MRKTFLPSLAASGAARARRAVTASAPVDVARMQALDLTAVSVRMRAMVAKGVTVAIWVSP